MKTFTATPADIEKEWIVIDAEGVVLGRLASIVAMRLRGKHKADLHPVDGHGRQCHRHQRRKGAGDGQTSATSRTTGTPVSRAASKSRTTGQILEGDHPERVVMQAVKRMLPGNRLSRKQMTNLRVYAGAEHPHEAQNPTVLDVKSMNPKNTRSA